MSFDPVTRPLDVLLLGATGFTGRRVAAELARASEKLRWGLAGRRREAAAVADGLEGTRCPPAEVVTVDRVDVAGLRSAVARAELVLSCVGAFITTARRCCAPASRPART